MAKTLFLLDWDDTLIPTTWLGINDYLELEVNFYIGTQEMLPFSPRFKEYLERVKKFLITLKRCGRVIILSNSGGKWIKLSKIFLGVEGENLIEDIDIHNTTNKIHATDEILRNANKCLEVKHVISIGDGQTEKEAIRVQILKDPPYTCKYIKLVERPTLQELIEELEILTDNVTHIIEGKLSWEFSKNLRHI